MPAIVGKNTLCGFMGALILTLHAQAADVVAIEQCARITSADERILCLESALRQQSGVDTEYESSNVADPDASELVPDVDAAMPESGQPEVQLKETAATGTAGASTDREPTKSQVEEFGAPEKVKKESEIDAIDVNIVNVSNDAYGKFIYRTDSGQVWLQIDSRTTRYREIPFQAQIRKAAAGSFFLQPGNGGIAIRVSRTD